MVLVVGPRRRRRTGPRPALEARAQARRVGRQAAGGRAVVAELTGAAANELYKALTA